MNIVQEPSAPSSKKFDRRAQIMRTAGGLIASKGLRSLKVRDVAAAADCAVGTVYNEFEDLDALVLAVNRDTLGALDQQLAGAIHDDPAKHLHRLAETYLDFATRHPNLLRALFEHRMEGDRPFPEDFLDMVRRTFALMHAPLARLLPKAPDERVMMLARTMFSAAHGIISLGLEERLVAVPRQNLHQQVSFFIDTYLAGLGIKPSRDLR